MSQYLEYKGREKARVAPKVTDPDISSASTEQLLRGLMDVSSTSGSNLIYGEHASGSLPSLNDGDVSPVQLDDNSRLLVNLDTEIAGEDLGSDTLMTRLKLQDGNNSFGFVERDGPRIRNANEDGSRDNDSTLTASTQVSFTNRASVTSVYDHYTEAKPLVNVNSTDGYTTEARLIQAQRDGLTPADAPTADDISGDAEWRVIDSALASNNEAIADGGSWPGQLVGYQCDSETLVLQVKQGDGQQTDVDSFLSADKDK